MNRKLMAFVLAGALAAPAAAFAQQASTVQIYGLVNLGIGSYAATGSTANGTPACAAGGGSCDIKKRTRVFDDTSRLGFRGAEDLGGGLKAIFQIESGINVDTGNANGQNGLPNPNTGSLASRVSFVGLHGNFGKLTFGRQDVWWVNYPQERITALTWLNGAVPSVVGILGRGMLVGVTREPNTIQYSSPALGGVTAILSYEAKGEARGANATTDGKVLAATLVGQWGAFGAGYDWVRNQGNSGTGIVVNGQATDPSNTGHKLRAGWTYQPNSQISVLWIKSIQNNGGFLYAAGVPAVLANPMLVDPAATRLSQTSLVLNLDHAFGNMQALAQWGKVYDIQGCTAGVSCGATNATAYTIGLRYSVSRRTVMTVDYNTIRNAAAYNMDYAGNGMTSASYAGALSMLGPQQSGATVTMYSFGMAHSF